MSLPSKVSPQPPRFRGTEGLTIIELLVVISIIALISAVAVPNFSFVPGTEATHKLGNLLGDIRSAYDMSVLNRKPYRLVFEFKTGSYWLEATEDQNFFLGDEKLDRDPTPDEIKEKEAAFDEDLKRYTELAGREVEDAEKEKVIKPSSPLLAAAKKLKPTKWTAVDDAEWNKRALGPSFVIRSMQTEHLQRLLTLEELGAEGYAYLYFFPQGYVERAVIHLAPADLDDKAKLDEKTYTIRTEPYEGVATAETGYKEVDLRSDEKRR